MEDEKQLVSATEVKNLKEKNDDPVEIQNVAKNLHSTEFCENWCWWQDSL